MCTDCEEWMPETEEYFYLLNKQHPERGYTSKCKKCTIKRNMKHQKDNPEQFKKSYTKYNNSEKHKKIKRNFIEENKENIREYQAEYQKNNPDKIKTYNETRLQRYS